jgi:hypothetical protein
MGEFSGALGSERDFGTGSTNLTSATERIMRRMCTPMHGAPRGYKGEQPTLLPGLFRHLRESVMCITADSASDEILSAEIMRPNTLAGLHGALTPNLRFVLRDKAHASRRIISRPWSADTYLKDVVFMFASGRGPMAQLIQHSVAIRRVFCQLCQDMHAHTCQDYGHKHEGCQAPIRELCQAARAQRVASTRVHPHNLVCCLPRVVLG